MAGFKVDYKYKNDIDLLDTVMYLFSKTVLRTELSDKERLILRAYLLHGYSKQTKKSICLDIGMTAENLNVRNSTLQKKGFLRPHPTTQNLKLINDELIAMRDCFINDHKIKGFIVSFTKQIKNEV